MSETTGTPPTPPGPDPTDGPTPGPTAPTRPHVLQQTWDAMRRSGIRRPLDDRWLGGVCSGVARRLGVDPVLIRVTVVALTLIGGFGVLAYALALVLLPDADGRVELERASHGELTGTTVGAVGLVLLAIVVPGPWDVLRGASLVQGGELVGALVVGTLLLIGLALLPKLREQLERSAAARPSTPAYGAPAAGPTPGAESWYGQSYDPATTYRTPTWTPTYGSPSAAYGATTPSNGPTPPAYGPPPAPRPPRPPRAVRRGPGPGISAAATGLALVAAGAGWLAGQLDVLDGRPAVLAACAALAVLGLFIVGLGIAGRRDGGVGGTAFLVLLVVAAVLMVPSWRTTILAGDAFWQPGTEARAEQGGTLGLGDATLDLSGLVDLPPGADVQVPVRVGIGELEVLVPEGMDVSVRAAALVGSTARDDGFDVDEVGGVGVERWLVRVDDPQVVVDARALVGSVRLVEVDAP